MKKTLVLCLVATLVASFVPARACAQGKVEEQVAALEKRVHQLESRPTIIPRPQESAGGGVVFLYGVFCALWAQNTGRSAWLWFFLGLLFNVITVIVLLVKNADDRKRLRRREEHPADIRA